MEETENQRNEKDPCVPRTVVMLSGWMQSGKDTVGSYLCKHFGFSRFAFADVLKDEVSEMWNVPRDMLDTGEGKATVIEPETGRTARDVLIAHGQRRRSENPAYWVERVIHSIESKEKKDEHEGTRITIRRIVITDWRFPNEYAFFKRYICSDEAKGKVHAWRIDRWTTPPLRDPTELALDDFPFDCVLLNARDVAHLYQMTREIMWKLDDPNVHILLTDVDEVLLRWIDGFSEWVQGEGYTVNALFPDSWYLSTWIIAPDGTHLTDEQVHEIVLRFNHSERFAHLQPCSDSREALAALKSLGWNIVAISSCTDNVEAGERRRENLQKVFGESIDYIFLLPLASCKRSVLKKFSPSLWIDDNAVNVRAGLEMGHNAFLMRRPWNESSLAKQEYEGLPVFEHWNHVLKFVTCQNVS